MEYNISYKEENIPVPLSGSIVRLADKIISQIIMDHYRTEIKEKQLIKQKHWQTIL